jgi:hypothetical protein
MRRVSIRQGLACYRSARQYGVRDMKTKLVTWLGGASTGLLLGGMAIFNTGCAAPTSYTATTTAYEPGQYTPYDYAMAGATYKTYTYPTPGYATYEYDYYPAENMYYSPATGMYHWYQDGQWRSARHLPPQYTAPNPRYGRLVQTHAQPPWRQQVTVSYEWTYPTPSDFRAHGF